ncbi:hypothetical protein KVR01_002829 [Diaporthe batatas]|uniref:uncharacterized protein n=1 Tax=Diaporthe batatas TaxID=748121 RepID=UPI001D046520|nr:uncharacterized protein KVR01_002829 [Diaporthe batatas]KAG8167140.1 hypothetical protein KVR01_002829 [Diaporthe batatas]
MSHVQKALIVTEISKPVKVAGINPHDQKARDHGLFISESLPAILTNDVVGTVTKLGEGASGVAVGDRVVTQPGFAPGSTQNGLQEFAVADVGAFSKVPEGTSDDEAATLPTNIIAPLVALFGVLKIPAPWTAEAKGFDYKGTTLLVVGGGSNCGRFGVQLAKLAGIGRIVVVGGNEAELKGLGATHVLDRHGGHDAVLARIGKVVGDDLVYAYDAVSPPEDQVVALNALSSTKRGALARLLPLGPVDESKVVGKTAGFEVRDTFGSSQANPELAGGFWERLPGFLQEGKIKPTAFVVKQGLTAENVNEVLDAYRDGKAVRKTHIHI